VNHVVVGEPSDKDDAVNTVGALFAHTYSYTLQLTDLSNVFTHRYRISSALYKARPVCLYLDLYIHHYRLKEANRGSTP